MRLIVNCKSGKQSQLFAIFLAIWFVTTLSLTKQSIVALLQSPVWLNLKIFIEELVVFNQIVNINIFMQYQLLKTFRISYCVMSRILDIYKFWNYSISTIMLEVVRLGPPSHNSTPYYDPSTTLLLVLRCTRVLDLVKRHDSDFSFPFSVNFCRIVSQFSSMVTLFLEDWQGLIRWCLPEMR